MTNHASNKPGAPNARIADLLESEIRRLRAANAEMLAVLRGAVSHDNALHAQWKVPVSLLRQMTMAIAAGEAVEEVRHAR